MHSYRIIPGKPFRLNKPTKTKKAMNTIKFLNMAALVVMGAILASCTKEKDVDPVSKDNIVVCTTTIRLDAAGTKALTIVGDKGVKTFAVGEQVALSYWNTEIDNWDKALSQTLIPKDISADGKTAKLTFTMTNPEAGAPFSFCYPAAMANTYGQEEYANLHTQDGTLASLSANLDLAIGYGHLLGTSLPANVTLTNELAILAITLKDSDGSNDITSTITDLTLSDGTNNYSVTRPAADGPIYVAILPTDSATIDVNALGDTKAYLKTLTGKTYKAGNGYNVSWMMAEQTNLSIIHAAYTASDGETLTGTLGSNVKISIADGATVTLNGVSINKSGSQSGNFAGITCEGDATIILKGENNVRGFYTAYPGIQGAAGKTLTITGTGSLYASSSGWGAGIGAGSTSQTTCGDIIIAGGTITAVGGQYSGAGIGSGESGSCGNITLSGGTITATGGRQAAGIGSGDRGHCGNITLSGGTVTATGGEDAAGIGSGYSGSCGTITIKSTVTQVTANKGGVYATNSIGRGYNGTCGTVTIGGTEGAITTSPYTYPAP